MGLRLHTLETGQVDPYANLALEECLLDAVGLGEIALFLWQNERTVVIGRNQNALDECDVATLEADGGHLARRISGGGAVYHDLGNLNFTFVVPAELWDVGRQSNVLLRALRSLGIEAERSGRNDLTAGGRKLSGHAFYHRGDVSFHHGTLMVDVDPTPLARYLNVSPLKLGAKGVASVRSRVTNLVELAPSMGIDSLKEALVSAFGEEYGGVPTTLPEGRIDAARLAQLAERNASREWLLRDVRSFEHSESARFAWGTVRLDWTVRDGRIADCALYSDGLDADLLERIPGELVGTLADEGEVAARLHCIGAPADLATMIGTAT